MAASIAYAEKRKSPIDIETSESPDRIVLRYTLGDYQTRTVNIGGQDYQEPRIAGEPVTTQAGAPQLPKVCRSIIIPDDAQMALRVLAADYEEVPAKIAPSKGNLPRSVDPRDVPCVFGDAYRADAFYPGELARLGTPYILRDYRGVVVELYPFQYNPVTGVLRVYKNITLEVVPAGPGETNVLERNAGERQLSRAFHQLCKHHFVNYRPKLRYPPLDEDGDMLIIVHDPWIPNVEPLAAHKNSIGINTTVVGVSTIGNNAAAIQNYVQSVYDASDLAFVLLVGDIQQVATPYASGAPSDPTYAKLAGGDDYPDVMVGRFSAQNALHVDTQVQRTIEYEVNQATQQQWFWRGAGIGSEPGQLDAIRDELLAHGYSHVDQIYDPDATPEMIAAALNEGRGIVNYIGHGSSSFWGTGSFFISDINELINADMLPFIFSVASLNGNFAVDTCFAEAWLRAQQGGVPTGAIATYMASDYQYWDGPQVAQQEFVDLYVNEAYVSFGTLCFAGACRMIDEYGPTGAMMFDTWIVFGDPSLRIVGTVSPPSTWYVDDDAPNDPGPGDPTISDPDEDGSPEHPFDAIQEGIDTAVDGDTVLVLDGTYTGMGNKDLDFHGKAITVRSENSPDVCIIDCEWRGRAFYFHNGEAREAVVDGFTIQHGRRPIGAGVRCQGGSSPTFRNCVFSENAAEYWGGGMDNSESSPALINCAFSRNYAGTEGGGLSNASSDPTLTNCTFTRNSAFLYGGGMLNYQSSPALTACTFSGNTADLEVGGGMCNSQSSPLLIHCVFSGNTARRGAGMYNGESSPILLNCLISLNVADLGAGMYCSSFTNPTVINCTIAHNTADDRGGALYCTGDSGPAIANCILWGDTPQEINVESGMSVVTYSDVQGSWPGVGNIDADPLFVDPDGPDNDPNTWEDNDYRLSPGSPCIDAGCNCGVPPDFADLDGDGDTDEIAPFDLDGEGRFFDDPDTPDSGSGWPPIVDMGAYEFGGSGPQPCVGDLDNDRDVDLSDLAGLLAHYGATSGMTQANGDLDCDGDVDLNDLSTLLSAYGTSCD